MTYRYPDPRNKNTFQLSHFDNNNSAIFKCGHKVTDNVFRDMINVNGQLCLDLW